MNPPCHSLFLQSKGGKESPVRLGTHGCDSYIGKDDTFAHGSSLFTCT